jgi:hypothetical protein
MGQVSAYWVGSLLMGWWSGLTPGGRIGPWQQACWASTRWISAQEPFSNKNFFSFSNLFYKLQINLNSNPI